MRFSAKKLTAMAMLTAAALIIFMIESQVPIPLPIPGIKLGFANIVTLFALYSCSGKEFRELDFSVPEAFMILLCRIILGAAFSGRVTAFFYSAAGGLLAFAAMAALRRVITARQLWAAGAVGAVFHNIGQILIAVLITKTPSVALYLPVLTAAGIVTGVFTGLVAQLAIIRLGGAGKG